MAGFPVPPYIHAKTPLPLMGQIVFLAARIIA
jgi:hypothetical protein